MNRPGVNGKLADPTDEQWEAIRRCDQHLLVAASAGTGKTFTVVRKLLYLMGTEVRGQTVAQPLRLRDVAAITYTNKAAAELKKKLRADLRAVGRRGDAYEVDSARVGTIHAFCGDVLREFALRSGRSPSLDLADDTEGQRIAGEVVRDTLLAALEDDGVVGLNDLLTKCSVSQVEEWVRALLQQGDHLRAIATGATGMSAAERVLLALAERTRGALEDRLVESGAMDFDRMITWTRDLLRDDPVVRKALQRRVKVLVIDEFQDVDPVQKEIAWLLGDPESGRTDTTRLVLVGDPKQSIYRFRRADVTVWRAVQDQFERSRTGVVVALSQSRRSVPDVLAFVDHAVGSLLDSPIDGTAHQAFEVPHAPVTSTRLDRPAYAGVELLCVAPTDEGKAHKAEIVRRTEAEAIAARARALHDERGVRWGDIALLLTGWGAMDVYVDALRRAGIPTYALRGEGFWDRREVLDVLVALDALRDPNEKRWLLGFLRSPMVGLTDESLLSLVRARSDVWSRRHGLTLADAEQQARWEHGIALLERWSVLRDRVSVSELMEVVLADTGYCAHLELLATDDARQRIGNVRKLVRLAAADPEATVGDFLADVAEQRALDVREGDARLYGEGDDVVTVSSVHSAKGLEWSVVFWCDLVRKSMEDHSRLLVGRASLMLGDDVKPDDQSPGWQALREVLKAEKLAETRRLWYVAATRAKDLLVMSGVALASPSEKKKPAKDDEKRKMTDGSVSDALRGIFPSLGGASNVELISRRGERHSARVSTVPAIVDEPEAVDPPALADMALLGGPHAALTVEEGSQRSSATQLMSRERCGKRHWLSYVVGLREPKPVFTRRSGSSDDTDLSAIEHGLVVHDVMERWEREADVPALVEDALERHAGDSAALDGAGAVELRRSLLAEIGGLVSRPEVASLLQNPHGRRELRFLLVEPDGMAYEGAIDLIAPAAGGHRLVDVKTSQCSAEDAVKKADGYTRQRDLYGRAVREIAGAPVTGFSFAFSGAEVVVESPAGELGQVPPARPEMARDSGECRYCGFRGAGWCEGVPDPVPASALS